MIDKEKRRAQKRLRAKRWYQKYKERIKAHNNAYYHTLKNDPAKLAKVKVRQATYQRKWRAKNWAHFLEDARIRQRRYRKERPEHFRAKEKRKYERIKSDPERNARLLKTSSAWGRRNTAKRTITARKWRTKHPEVFRAGYQRRRARKASAKGSHTIAQWLARVELYGWRCAYCKKHLTPKTLTKDHIIPLSRGGTDWASNLVPACLPCNSGKGNRRPTQD